MAAVTVFALSIRSTAKLEATKIKEQKFQEDKMLIPRHERKIMYHPELSILPCPHILEHPPGVLPEKDTRQFISMIHSKSQIKKYKYFLHLVANLVVQKRSRSCCYYITAVPSSLSKFKIPTNLRTSTLNFSSAYVVYCHINFLGARA